MVLIVQRVADSRNRVLRASQHKYAFTQDFIIAFGFVTQIIRARRIIQFAAVIRCHNSAANAAFCQSFRQSTIQIMRSYFCILNDADMFDAGQLFRFQYSLFRSGTRAQQQYG